MGTKTIAFSVLAVLLFAVFQFSAGSRIAMDVKRKGGSVEIVLKNNDVRPVRIWEKGNISGDLQFRFVFQDKKGARIVARRDNAVYTVHSPEVAEIAPSSSRKIDFDFADRTWSHQNLSEFDLIDVILSIEINESALEQRLLLDRVFSHVLP